MYFEALEKIPVIEDIEAKRWFDGLMTDEEKKVVKDLKLFLDKKNYLTDKELQTILNLIERQEKVIIELKNRGGR